MSVVTRDELPSTIRAAVYHGRGDVRIEEVDRPSAGEGELLVRVTVAGICGTDAHEYDGGPPSSHWTSPTSSRATSVR